MIGACRSQLSALFLVALNWSFESRATEVAKSCSDKFSHRIQAVVTGPTSISIPYSVFSPRSSKLHYCLVLSFLHQNFSTVRLDFLFSTIDFLTSRVLSFWFSYRLLFMSNCFVTIPSRFLCELGTFPIFRVSKVSSLDFGRQLR